jgi:hypothetical protein
MAGPKGGKGEHFGVRDCSSPQTLQHLPAMQNRVNRIGILNCHEFWMKRSIGKKRLELYGD